MEIPFIPEAVIDTQLVKVNETKEAYLQALEDLHMSQPHVAAFVVSDTFDLLTEAEKDYLLYLTVVLCGAIRRVYPDVPVIPEARIGTLEEKNWEQMEKRSNLPFRARVDVFFEAIPQEDLLAFVEDSLTIDKEDKEEFLTTAGAELMFVGLATIIGAYRGA